jgi:SAM-dependent methyltransferase
MPPLRQRLVQDAMRSRSLSRNLSQRASAALQRRGPVHAVLRDLYRFSRRHPVNVTQWDAEYSEGEYTERLDTITHVAHHAVILGYLSYGAKEPMILDIGCGHGRLLQLLAGLDFAEYVGVDWSAEGIDRARSLLIPRTRFEVADMNHWDTTERFDAIVLNNCLSYSDDPPEMFERALGWLAEDGLVITAMYRGLGARYIWSRIESTPVEQVAACAVKDAGTGAVWDVKALRPRGAANPTIGKDWHRPASPQQDMAPSN